MNGVISDATQAGGWLPEGFVGELLPFVLTVWDEFWLPVAVTDEERITGLFRKFLKQKVRHSQTHNWIVLPESGVEDHEGRIIGYTDLPVMHRKSPDTDSAFVFECKRLNVTYPSGKYEDNADQYTDEGMTRFLTGKYSPGLHEGGMLGYVMDCDTSKARTQVVNMIESRREKLRLVVGSGYLPCVLLGNREPHGETCHKLEGGRDFVIYHLLVPIQRTSSA